MLGENSIIVYRMILLMQPDHSYSTSRTRVLFGSHQQATCFSEGNLKNEKRKQKQKNTWQEHKSPKTWNRMKIWTGRDPQIDHNGAVLD